jgi:dTDP-glucose 4,6-dehydratase
MRADTLQAAARGRIRMFGCAIMKLLVTGALGFVGTALIRRLLDAPGGLAGLKVDELTVVDVMTYAANQKTVDVLKRNNVPVIEADVCDAPLMNSLVREHNCVIHLAGETSVDRSLQDPPLFARTNIIGTQTILEAARQAGEVRIVHISTDEVWGQVEGRQRFDEMSPYSPRNPYAATKAAADHLVRSYGKAYGLRYNIVHFTNLYGPWQHPEKLIPGSIARILAGEKIQLHGTGGAMRSWLHVDDAIQGVLQVLAVGGERESYIIGAGTAYSNLRVARMILARFGRTDDDIAFIADRPVTDTRYAVDCSKAKRALGWRPTVEFADGLGRVVDWAKSRYGTRPSAGPVTSGRAPS